MEHVDVGDCYGGDRGKNAIIWPLKDGDSRSRRKGWTGSSAAAGVWGHLMFPFDWSGEHTRRTREHVIEEMSLNFLERKVLVRGHQLVPATRREYGCDATMFHFCPDSGAIENGEVRFQIKATDHLDPDAEFAICSGIETRHLHYWYWEAQKFPFVLVLYDAMRHRGYWVDVRKHVEDVLNGIDTEQKTVTIRMPWSTKITVKTIDRFREMSLERMNREG